MNIKTISSDVIVQESKTLTGTVDDLGKNENDYLKSGDFSGAINYYNDLYTNNSSDIGLKNKYGLLLIDSYLKYANYNYSEIEYSKKANDILEQIKGGLGDDLWQYYYFNGYIKEITQDYNSAIAFYNQSLESVKLEEKKAHIINQIGHVYDLKGELEKANEYYLKSEKLSFHIPANLINRGRYEYRKGNNDKAESYFNQVIGLNVTDYINSEMYYNLSSIYLAKTDGLDKSIEYSEKGINSYDKYPYNYLSLGMAYIYKGGDDIEKALPNFNKVVELHPNSSNGYKWLGIYYYTVDNYEKAIENFEKQEKVSETDIALMKNEKEESKKSAIYDLAKTYALMGDSKKSMLYLKQVLDGNNKNIYHGFLRDFGYKDGPFAKVITDPSFMVSIKKIIILYNNKK